MSVKLISVIQQYPSATSPLYNGFSAEFETGKVHVILGASGSGKTTLLNVIANLCDYKGVVECGALSYVFQDARLIENITVRQNLELVLRGIEKDKSKRKAQVDEYLRLAEIDKYADVYPDKLSGGEQQRLAIARAFAYPSEVLLMDEPFNSLDYGVKARLIKSFLTLLERSPRTMLFVTHDVDEALTLADEIYILQDKPVTLIHAATLTADKSARDVYSADFAALKRDLTSQL